MKLKNILRFLLVVIVLGLSASLTINIEVINTTRNQIIDISEIDDDNDYDCILVLGAGVRNGEPSKILKERLDTGIDLYNKGLISTFIMSGDHGQINYDEVNVMKKYALDNNIPSSSVFMDHAGFSTYDSLYRAKYVFGVKKVLIVTEKYHLYRALFIANSLGIEAYGVDATKDIYYGQTGRDIREFLARNKDFFKSLIKPKSKYVGSSISLDQDGDVTNDNHIIISTPNGEENYYVSSFMTYKTINDYVKRKDYKEFKCDCKPNYYLTFNDNKNDTYGIFLYGKTIHIMKDDKKIILTEDDAKVIFDIINKNE